MSRAKPWEDDERFNHPDTRVDRWRGDGEAVVVRYPGGGVRTWERDVTPGRPGGDWTEKTSSQQ